MDNLAADFEINPNNPLNAEYELGEGVGFDCSFELFASGTVWGNIDGDINNQTDLISLLNTKVDLTSFEELSQTVTNNYNELSDDISDLTGTVTDNYNTLSGQISDLLGVVNDNYTSLDNRLTTAEGSILDLTDTVNDNYTAINNRIDGIVDSFDGDISDLNDAIDNLSDTVSDNYTDLNDKITDNTDDITTIQNTINSYGDIVSYNAAYFATANQGALADTALQPNDNISELTNDVGYITSASLPTVNNATITIQKNGTDVGTFTLNQANNDTLNITVPTQASDIGAMPDTTTIGDLTTTAQLNALNSGATVTNIGQITTNQDNIADIRSLIPLQASTSNQLADKSFVNSSIATNTAYFIGTFNSVAELEAYSGPLTNNDYAFVATTDSAGNTLYDRYKYNADTQQWIFEYELNNSSFTAQQWASINSGITSGDVTLIGTALQPNDNISELTNDAGYITSASLPTVNNGTLDIQVNGTSVGTFTANQSGNTTANIVVPDSATWGNITGTLSNQTDLQTALNSKYDASNPDGYITSADLPTNYVTTNTAQNISGRKTFLGEKAIYFKQNVATDKLGFTLYSSNNTELGALEYRPNTISGKALLAINCSQLSGNFVGFRYWASGAINIIAPKPSTAGDYYIPVSITDGTNTVTANNNGTLNISSLLPDISDMATQTWVTNQGYTTNVGTVTSVNNTQPDASGNVTLTIPDTATWGNITGTLSDQTDLQTALDAKQNTISDLSTIRSGASLGATALQPNDNITELVNNAGYITGITSSDVTTALGYTPYNSTNPSGYITSADLPTVDQTFDGTSINAQSGVAINGELASAYQVKLVSGTNIKTINNTSLLGSGNISVLQNTATGTNALTIGGIATQNTCALNIGVQSSASGDYSTAIGENAVVASNASRGTAIGSNATAYQNAIAIGVGATASQNTIQIGNGSNSTANSLSIGFYNNQNYQLLDGSTGLIPYQRINSVVDNNSGSLKFWSGTKAQYDAIGTKDANTLYNITDDSNPTLSMLELLYPVGSIYIGTMSACPLQTLGVGTWQLVATDRVLQGAGTRGNVGTTVNESLPNIKGVSGNNSSQGLPKWTSSPTGAIYDAGISYNIGTNNVASAGSLIGFDASRSSSTYQDNAPVQQDAYLVNIWERIS